MWIYYYNIPPPPLSLPHTHTHDSCVLVHLTTIYGIMNTLQAFYDGQYSIVNSQFKVRYYFSMANARITRSVQHIKCGFKKTRKKKKKERKTSMNFAGVQVVKGTAKEVNLTERWLQLTTSNQHGQDLGIIYIK